MLELYRNIKKLRLENKLSQEELAKKVGYTDRSSIAKIEKGEFDLPQSKIFAFAEALGVTASRLMGEDGLRSENSHANRYANIIDIDSFTEEELEEIIRYSQYIKSKRKKPDR